MSKAVLVAGVVLCILGALAVPDASAQSLSLYVIYGILALSLVMVWGWGGIFSFGQTAFFGLGAYAYGVVGINVGNSEWAGPLALLGAIGCGAVAACALGYFMFYGNVSGVYVAIITLASTLVLLTVTSSMADPSYRLGDAIIGGYNGMLGIPGMSLPGIGYLDARQYFLFCVGVALSVALAFRWIRLSTFGRIVFAVTDNETRAQLLGFDVRAYKLVTFVMGGAVAGLAGALFASWALFISPVVFGLSQAALLVIWVLVGGRDSILGAFLGVYVVQRISDYLGEGGGSYTPIVLGSLLIAVVLVVPGGIVPTAMKLAASRTPKNWRRFVSQTNRIRRDAATDVAVGLHLGPSSNEDHALRTAGLEKSFGGVKALRDVSVQCPEQGVLCLIGANGAGKSTFFNVLAGRLAATKGSVFLGGEDITRLRPDQRAKRGLGIKLQVPCVFPTLSVWDNIWLAAYSGLRQSDAATDQTAAVLQRLSFDDSLDISTPASDLPHGAVQWLEIAMVFAAGPAVILLDEPTAGMSHDDTYRTADLILELGQHSSVVVVEHDMDFVRTLDSPVVMFHEGAVFRRGTLAELQADEVVLDVYMGRGATA
ncbi:MAG TPA: ATP-binding cassette domain-containing protein [Nocardioides sp.]|nr:ATP-binding cassette domain-containing protein [Nocardioides sp.]HRK44274.1 ATP-binding cassette domain-containing protein [Nocardioides sp.]